MKNTIELQKIVKIKRKVDELVKGRYKVKYHHSESSNSFYILLSDSDVKYDMRFSDHKPKESFYKTFYYPRYKEKDLERFIKNAIRKVDMKKINYLFKKIA